MEPQALRIPGPILCLPLYPANPTYPKKKKKAKMKIQQRDAMKSGKVFWSNTHTVTIPKDNLFWLN